VFEIVRPHGFEFPIGNGLMISSRMFHGPSNVTRKGQLDPHFSARRA
jgi:hypothetical protein